MLGHQLRQTPRTNTLLAISKALDCRLQDLVRPVGELAHVRFRARSRLTRRDQILAQVFRWLSDFSSLESLMEETEEFKLHCLAADSKQLTPLQVAGEARKMLGLKLNEPIHDICGLLESCGIKVLALPYASDAFNGLSVGEGDKGPAIIINSWERITTERQIFSAAHELGHLLMHSVDYDGSQTAEDTSQEQEADLFAGYFLMPGQGFDSEWESSAGMPFVNRVMKIKGIFKVSYKTVLYRLKQKEIVNDTIWYHFGQLYETRYHKKLSYKEEPCPKGSEPFGLRPFDFSADRLIRLVRQAVEGEKISISRAAEILDISSQQMLERIAEWEGLG